MHGGAMGPVTAFSQELHAAKYRRPDEDFREAMNRIAAGLKDDDKHFHAFRSILLDMRFLPGGRIQSAIGSGRSVTGYNCFVSGTISDSMTGHESSIMGRAAQAAETMRRGGGIGYDFSTLRPRGALIKKLQSSATGPISFMEIFDAVGRSISSSGHRRGAQMGVLRVDHPDIEEFVRAKHRQGHLTGFNVSVAVTDDFMRAVENDGMHQLVFERRAYGEVRARDLWETIMRGTWDWAEPGVLFIDRINEQNNLRYCETIAATNPCGEQPLPPFGACLLGSFNLCRYLIQPAVGEPTGFDFAKLRADIPHVVRAMDNVVDRSAYPLVEQEQEAHIKRRMGLGITGLSTALAALGFEYGTTDFCEMMGHVMEVIRDGAYEASADIAAEKGCFRAFERDAYLAAPFVARLPNSIRDKIARAGIRNSHLLSVAPTGTISMAADNISSGVEPVFALKQKRIVAIDGEPREVEIVDYGIGHGWKEPKVAADCSVSDHLAVLEVASVNVDSAVSKTCNVPPTMPWDDFKGVYVRAWKMGAKGCTTFNPGGQRTGIMSAAEADTSCRIDEETGRKECA